MSDSNNIPLSDCLEGDISKPYTCIHCNEKFDTLTDIKIFSNCPKKISTDITIKPYGCAFCDEKFGTLREIKIHSISYCKKQVYMEYCTYWTWRIKT
jgi:hypothetical protein